MSDGMRIAVLFLSDMSGIEFMEATYVSEALGWGDKVFGSLSLQ